MWENQLTNKYRAQERGMKPGFSTTSKTRPLIISKLEQYYQRKISNNSLTENNR